MTVLTTQQLVDYLGFTITGSQVFAPSIVQADGTSGNQFIISSGSFQSILNASDSFIIAVISRDTALGGSIDYATSMSSANVISLAQKFALDYTGFMIWVTMFGGIIQNGWDYRLSELEIKRTGIMIPSARALVEGYRLAAELTLRLLQPLSISMEGTRVEDIVGNVAPAWY